MVNYQENIYLRRGSEGRSHIPALPFWVVIIRVVQLVCFTSPALKSILSFSMILITYIGFRYFGIDSGCLFCIRNWCFTCTSLPVAFKIMHNTDNRPCSTQAMVRLLDENLSTLYNANMDNQE